MCLLILQKGLWAQLWLINFQNATFEKNYHNSDRSFSFKCSFLPLVPNKNNNEKHAEYHVTFTPFQGRIYSKQGSHVSALFGTSNLVLFSHV